MLKKSLKKKKSDLLTLAYHIMLPETYLFLALLQGAKFY